MVDHRIMQEKSTAYKQAELVGKLSIRVIGSGKNPYNEINIIRIFLSGIV